MRNYNTPHPPQAATSPTRGEVSIPISRLSSSDKGKEEILHEGSPLPQWERSPFRAAKWRVRGPYSSLLPTATFAILLSVFLSQTELKVNQTPSLGYKVFFCIKGLALNRGDFVTFNTHPTAYFGDISYTKRLMGMPGDLIHIDEDQIFINNQPIGTLRTSTQDGKILTPLKSRSIPEGYVFVSADHSRSFDSRYEEFGLVKETCLKAKCFGFFKVNTPVQESSL